MNSEQVQDFRLIESEAVPPGEVYIIPGPYPRREDYPSDGRWQEAVRQWERGAGRIVGIQQTEPNA